LICIYPFYKQIKKNKEQGLALLITFPIQDIQKTLNAFTRIQRIIDKNTVHVEPAKHKINIDKKAQKKGFRTCQLMSLSSLKFALGILIIFSISAVYSIVNYVRIINHNNDFILFYNEYITGSRLMTSFETQYASAYQVLYFYNENTQWIDNYFQSYQPIYKINADNLAATNKFWLHIDALTDSNSDCTPTYLNQERLLSNNDVCDFITLVEMTPEKIQECKQSLSQTSKLGFLNFITSIFQIFSNQLQTVQYSNYARYETVLLVNDIDFKGLDNLLFYGNFVLRQYVLALQQNLTDVLQNQNNESYIFLGIGILLMVSSFVGGWYPFSNYMRKDFAIVKKIYGIFPIYFIIGNRYIRRWLTNNTKQNCD